MAPASSRELLDLLLEDGDLTPADLDEFIARVQSEDLYLEYKDGRLTQDKKNARATVRESVSGFANAEGGVLIVGVSEGQPRSISPCGPIGGEQPDVWAQKILSDMIGSLSPPPRFKLVHHAQGDALLIATAPAPQLVPCVESGETKFFLRFHDSTREAPPYLISDLILGRRSHPTLEPDFDEAEFKYERSETHMLTAGVLRIRVTIENASFVFADDVEFGIVGWTLTSENAPPLSKHLRSHVDVEHPMTPGSNDWKLTCAASKQYGRSGKTFAPFDHSWQRLGAFRLPRSRAKVPGFPLEGPMLFRSGFYVLAAGSPPTWYQLDITIADEVRDWRDVRQQLSRDYIHSTRLVSKRPVIAWHEKQRPS